MVYDKSDGKFSHITSTTGIKRLTGRIGIPADGFSGRVVPWTGTPFSPPCIIVEHMLKLNTDKTMAHKMVFKVSHSLRTDENVKLTDVELANLQSRGATVLNANGQRWDRLEAI